jgi:hypothetical protein
VVVTASERRRYQRSWKLAATLLGIVALVAASTAVRLVDVDAPLDVALFFGVMVVVLAGGTLWLVPSSRSTPPGRHSGTADPRR